MWTRARRREPLLPGMASGMHPGDAMKTLRTALLLVLPVLAAACAEKPAARAPTDVTSPSSTSAAGVAKKDADRVGVSDDIVRACNVTIDNPTSAPKFDLDTSELTAEDRAVLDQVARCVTTGPLRGNSLSLVGRADPRGEQEYNMVLGGSRAAAVRTYLTHAGVDGARIATTSRGKLDATGSDEATWRLDRRVDVELDKHGEGVRKSTAGARVGTGR